jgi:hypothetical protein
MSVQVSVCPSWSATQFNFKKHSRIAVTGTGSQYAVVEYGSVNVFTVVALCAEGRGVQTMRPLPALIMSS